jgi:hypothetical protein
MNKNNNTNTNLIFKNNKEIYDFIKKQTKQQIDDYDMKVETSQLIFEKLKTKSYFKNMLFYIIVKDNKIYTLFEDVKGGDNRKKVISKFIIPLIKKWFKKNNKNNNNNLFIPFYISDTHFYHDNNIPFFVESKPRNKKGLTFPDSNLLAMKLEDKTINYDEFIKIIHEKKCQNEDKKKSLIFFSGANTGADKHNVRMKLKGITEKDKNYELFVDESYFPLYHFCEYKYLLNLPGHQPWSYRLTKILPMGSLVIDVNVLQQYSDIKEYNEQWIQCYVDFFKKEEDYIQIDYPWVENRTSDDYVYKLYYQINQVYQYYEQNNNEYKKIVERAEKKSKMMNMKVFEDTMMYMIIKFNDKMKEVNGEEKFNENIEYFLNHHLIKSEKINRIELSAKAFK